MLPIYLTFIIVYAQKCSNNILSYKKYHCCFSIILAFALFLSIIVFLVHILVTYHFD